MGGLDLSCVAGMTTTLRFICLPVLVFVFSNTGRLPQSTVESYSPPLQGDNFWKINLSFGDLEQLKSEAKQATIDMSRAFFIGMIFRLLADKDTVKATTLSFESGSRVIDHCVYLIRCTKYLDQVT
jgi:hypothetical protein